MADKTIQIHIKALIKGVAEVRSLTRALADLKKFQSTLGKVDASSAKLGDLGKNLQALVSAVKNLSKLDEAARKAGVNLGKLSDESEDLATSTNKAAGGADKLGDELNDLGGGAGKARVATVDLQGQFEQFEKGLQVVGRALTDYITKPMLAAAEAAVTLSADLQTQVANISAIRPDLDTTALYASINKMQRDLPFTLKEIGDEVYDVFSTIDGITQEGAVTLTRNLGRGATGALTDIRTFGTSIIGVLNAYHLALEDVGYVQDVFFNTVNKGAIEGKDLAANLGELTAPAKQLGLDFGTLGAAIAAVTLEGGNAAENTTYLKNVLIQLSRAETQVKLRDMLGVDVFDPITKKARKFVDIIGDIKKAIANLNPEAKSTALSEIFPEVRAVTGITKLDSQFETLKREDAANRPGGKATGSADAAFEKQFATFNVQFALLKGRLRSVLLELGAAILPVLTPLVKAFSDHIIPIFEKLSAVFSKLPAGAKIFTIAIAAAAAALGPLLLLAAAITVIVGAIILVTAKIALIVTAVVFALAALAGVIISVVIAALVIWQKNMGGIQQTVQRVFGYIKQFITDVLNDLHAVYLRILPSLQSITEKILGTIAAFWAAHGETIKAIVFAAWKTISNIVRTAIYIIGNFIDLALKIIDGDWRGVWNVATAILYDFVKVVIAVGAKIIEAINNLITRITLYVLEKLSKIGTGGGDSFITSMVSAIFNGIPKVVAAVVSVAEAMANPAAFIAAALANVEAYKDSLAAGIEAANAAAKKQQYKEDAEHNRGVVKGFFDDLQKATVVKKEVPEGTGTYKAPGEKSGGGGDARDESERATTQVRDAQVGASLALQKDANERALRDNERAYEAQLRAFRAYVDERAIIQLGSLDLEQDDRELKLADTNARLARAKPADQGRLNVERINLEKDIELLKRQKADVEAQRDQDLLKHQKDLQKQYEEGRKQLLLLQGARTDEAGIELEERYAAVLKDINNSIAFETLLLKGRKAGRKDTTEVESSLKLLQARKQQIEQLKELGTQSIAFEDTQQKIAEIQERRRAEEERLAQAIRFTGQTEAEITAARLDIEKKYGAELSALIPKLETIVALVNAAGGDVRPVQKLIDNLKLQTANAGRPDLETQQRAAETETNKLYQQRDLLEGDIDRRRQLGLISGIRAEKERRQAILDTRDALLQALDAELKLAEVQQDTQRIAAIEDRKKAIEQEVEAIKNVGRQIITAAEDAAESGLTAFFQTLNDETKSFKDAVIAGFQAFIEQLQQAVTKMLIFQIISGISGKPKSSTGEESAEGAEGGGNIFTRLLGALGIGKKKETKSDTEPTDSPIPGVPGVPGLPGSSDAKAAPALSQNTLATQQNTAAIGGLSTSLTGVDASAAAGASDPFSSAIDLATGAGSATGTAGAGVEGAGDASSGGGIGGFLTTALNFVASPIAGVAGLLFGGKKKEGEQAGAAPGAAAPAAGGSTLIGAIQQNTSVLTQVALSIARLITALVGAQGNDPTAAAAGTPGGATGAAQTPTAGGIFNTLLGAAQTVFGAGSPLSGVGDFLGLNPQPAAPGTGAAVPALPGTDAAASPEGAEAAAPETEQAQPTNLLAAIVQNTGALGRLVQILGALAQSVAQLATSIGGTISGGGGGGGGGKGKTGGVVGAAGSILSEVVGDLAGSLFTGAVAGFKGDGDPSTDDGGFLGALGGILGVVSGGGGSAGTAQQQQSNNLIGALDANTTTLRQLILQIKQLIKALKESQSSGDGGGGFAALFAGAGAVGGPIAAAPKGRLVLAGEAGHDEMILTTDPKHKARTAALMTQFIRSTGILPSVDGQFARGGIIGTSNQLLSNVAPQQNRSAALPKLNGGVNGAALGAANKDRSLHLKQVLLLNPKHVHEEMRSSGGEQAILDVIDRNSTPIKRRLGI